MRRAGAGVDGGAGRGAGDWRAGAGAERRRVTDGGGEDGVGRDRAGAVAEADAGEALAGDIEAQVIEQRLGGDDGLNDIEVGAGDADVGCFRRRRRPPTVPGMRRPGARRWAAGSRTSRGACMEAATEEPSSKVSVVSMVPPPLLAWKMTPIWVLGPMTAPRRQMSVIWVPLWSVQPSQLGWTPMLLTASGGSMRPGAGVEGPAAVVGTVAITQVDDIKDPGLGDDRVRDARAALEADIEGADGSGDPGAAIGDAAVAVGGCRGRWPRRHAACR